jgi:hypothetical protein
MHYGRGLILASILSTGLALFGVSSPAIAQNLPPGEGSSAGGGVGPDVIVSWLSLGGPAPWVGLARITP